MHHFNDQVSGKRWLALDSQYPVIPTLSTLTEQAQTVSFSFK